MSFVTRTLGEICDEVDGIVQTGPFGSQLHRSDYQDEGTPVVMPKDLIGNKVSIENIARIGDKDVVRLFRHKLKKGDIVYARRGDIGRRALITAREAGWMCGTGCMRISLGDSVVHPIFLHYYLGQPDIVTWIYNQAIGATMPNLNTSIVRSIPITYPSLPTQRKIAVILSTYDDLIENNTRRIALLEQTAQLLYREWFVHFRFPGHESVPLAESELGPIPEGWEVKPITDLCSKLTDGTHDTPKPVDKGYHLVTGKHLVNGFVDFSNCYFISPEEHAKVMQRSKPEKGDIIFSNIGALGSTVLVDQDFEFSIKNVALFKPLNEANSYFLYLYLSSPDTLREMLQKASGTSQRFFSLRFLRRLKVVKPADSVLVQFVKVIGPVLNLRSSLNKRNTNLRTTRDLLLPRLISGQLDVAELEISGVRQE